MRNYYLLYNDGNGWQLWDGIAERLSFINTVIEKLSSSHSNWSFRIVKEVE